MKSQRSKPCLTSTGVEIPTDQLRRICKSWNQETWEEYLKWYETAQSEKLIAPDLYDDLVECESLSVFVLFCELHIVLTIHGFRNTLSSLFHKFTSAVFVLAVLLGILGQG